jgi:hypothetical protein
MFDITYTASLALLIYCRTSFPPLVLLSTGFFAFCGFFPGSGAFAVES